MSEYIIDTETIPTDAGDYTVEFIVDDCPERPYDEGFVLAVARTTSYDAVLHGDADDNALAAIQEGSISGKAIVRYLTLKGFKGVTLTDHSFTADKPSADRNERVHGFAYAPDDATDPDAYVKISLESWAAWANGDVFGYRVLDPQGNEVEDGSCWGYYGFSREYDYVLAEARSAAEYDAKQRVAQANLVGAGIVGVL